MCPERGLTRRYYDDQCRDYYQYQQCYLICREKHDHHRDCYRWGSGGSSNCIVNYGNLYIGDNEHARPHCDDRRVGYVRAPVRESDYYRVSETSVCVTRSRSSSRARNHRGSCRSCSVRCDLWDGGYCRTCYCLTVRTPRETIRICEGERDRPSWDDSRRRIVSYRSV